MKSLLAVGLVTLAYLAGLQAKAENGTYRFFVLNIKSKSDITSAAGFSIKKGSICGRKKGDDGTYVKGNWIDFEFGDQKKMRNVHEYVGKRRDFEIIAANYCEFFLARADDSQLITGIERSGYFREVPEK